MAASVDERIKAAISSGDKAALEAIRATGYSLDTEGENGMTPLMHAVLMGNPHNMIQTLLELGASINAKNKYERTAVVVAIQNDLPDVLELLLASGADLQTGKFSGGMHPLTYAVFFKSARLVDVLLKQGFDVNGRYDKSLLLSHALKAGNEDTFKFLLEQPGINLAPFEECAKNGGYLEPFNGMILTKLAFERIRANSVSYESILYTIPGFRAEIPRDLVDTVRPASDYDSHVEELVDTIDDDCICAREVGVDYIQALLMDKYIDFIVELRGRGTNELLGFFLAKFKGGNELYIDVICAKNKFKGFGTILTDLAKRMQKFYKRPVLSLNSVPKQVGFYERQGFKLTGEPTVNILKPMRFINVSLLAPPPLPPRPPPGWQPGMIPPPPPLPPPPPPPRPEGEGGKGGRRKTRKAKRAHKRTRRGRR